MPATVGSTRGYRRVASSPAKAASSLAPVVSRTLPCVAAKYCAAWAALPSTTLPAGKVLAARSRRWYSTPAALAAARMFLVASTA